MGDHRAGRAGQSGFSPRLGRKDPRARANTAGSVAGEDNDRKTIASDGAGRNRFSAFDGLSPLPADATLADVIVALNQMLARGRGQ